MSDTVDEVKPQKKAKKTASKKTAASKKTEVKATNLGKCCTCKYYPAHVKGVAQPCKFLKTYVPRKAEHPECWKEG